ncbi:MAG TPA: nucleotide sugar dehydrogenase [Candidatus Methanoculleus thermohydrogenotrophicum]|jgi:UDP-N-acetyl-D-mannosaminuronic acid dehydrogenase|nr:nucleotide sugar dehydrogenase [Candidatus Methanoculleus thermohydrogenotrophicum]NLM82963.1 nucleotide sugar dehydrogenase [Candidatus Methanoculleus thermohydrogenotrophicum]HOB17934.1 nucleotide sugar dehydrogenase [Candidatus Methanoculleus thermohydrogenotrophicum]HPZ38206.1 nucleotide sugar dehydrogenase [Candidatus Methanoculleus thermohydrogenotrophicum]HQC91451.1 nucleotide sugar dehydrogenase [Candidatus Methanoculleus thermohydrogenotrophicum]
MSTRLQSIIDERGPIRKIGVVGMGYVGVPAAALFADAPEFESVLGFQRNSATSGYKIAMLNRGESPLKGEEPGLEDLLGKVVSAGKFRCTSDFSEVAECDAVTLAIQTPFADPKDLIPDFSALNKGLRNVGRHITEGTLVVLESTVTPGTTAGMAREILEEESGLVAGEDFALAHAPERVMVGRLLKNIREHDRIVGGIDEVSTKRAVELYRPVLTKGKIIPMTATAAEVTKTAENAFRDLQIAAVNQLALHCEAMGVNVYDVRAGIDSLKGEGITRAILWPGAGVGGHCLTKDSWHLERGAQVLGGDLWYPHGAESIFGVARTINEFMPRHMVHLTTRGLERVEKSPEGATVALLGWAFIQNSDDARNTPAEPYLAAMEEAGAKVRVHDPFVEEYPGIEVSHDLDATLAGADVVTIFTGHHHYASLEAARVKELSGQEHPVIVDGRNVVDPDAFIRAGFIYKGIGRGDKNSHPIRR